MILLNELLIENDEIKNELISNIDLLSYNEESEKENQILIDYINDLYEADKKLTAKLQEKISEYIIPIVYFELDLMADLNELRFKVFSTSEDFKVKKSDELVFKHYCDVFFGGIEPLYNRIVIDKMSG